MEAQLSLLVADPDRDVRSLLHKTLTKEGFDVELAASGEEALERLKSATEYDAFVCDLRMPDINGEELLRAAVAARPELQVILMTGFGDIHRIKSLLLAGAFGYVHKPFKIPDLIRVIDEAIAPV